MYTFRKIKEFDTIIFNDDIREHIRKSLLESKELHLPVKPILYEGVIKVTDISEKEYMYLYFNFIESYKVRFEAYFYNRYEYEFKYYCSFVTNFTSNDDRRKISDWNIELKWEDKQKQELILFCENIFVGIISYLTYLSLHTKIELKDTEGNHIRFGKKTKAEPNTSNIKKHIVSIDKIRIVTNNPINLINDVRKEIKRHTESWTVRGHYRHLKNGKVSFIRPYTKGNKSDINGKIYEVNL